MAITYRLMTTAHPLYPKCVRLRRNRFWEPMRIMTSVHFDKEERESLIFGALKAGAKVFNSVSVEDLVFKNGKVNGLVINWTPVERLGMHVDPLTVLSKCVLDGTGHPSEIVRLAVDKAKVSLDTPTGNILGEKPMWVDKGEASTVENTKEYYPGLFACGMSANNVMGGYRMGPIFGGMLMSGKKAAKLIIEKLNK